MTNRRRSSQSSTIPRQQICGYSNVDSKIKPLVLTANWLQLHALASVFDRFRFVKAIICNLSSMKTPKPLRRRKTDYHGKLKWKTSGVDTQWQSLYRAMDVCQWSGNFVVWQIVIDFSLNAFGFWLIVRWMSLCCGAIKISLYTKPFRKNLSRGSINYVLFVPNLCRKKSILLAIRYTIFSSSFSSSSWSCINFCRRKIPSLTGVPWLVVIESNLLTLNLQIILYFLFIGKRIKKNWCWNEAKDMVLRLLRV